MIYDDEKQNKKQTSKTNITKNKQNKTKTEKQNKDKCFGYAHTVHMRNIKNMIKNKSISSWYVLFQALGS